MFAVLVLAAAAMGGEAAVATHAPIVLYARIGQSTAHLIATTRLLVLIRATFWGAAHHVRAHAQGTVARLVRRWQRFGIAAPRAASSRKSPSSTALLRVSFHVAAKTTSVTPWRFMI